MPPPRRITSTLPSHPKLDPVAGAAVDLQFGRALTDRLDVRGISIGKSSNCNGDSCGGLRIEPVIPIPKRDTTVDAVFRDLDFWYHIRYQFSISEFSDFRNLLLTRSDRFIMFPLCSFPQEGVSRPSRNEGWNAVDATASGAKSFAGRESFDGLP
ncbi:hypothetical protein ACVWW2_005991 [Bradyrhizobium sp. LM4.3]